MAFLTPQSGSDSFLLQGRQKCLLPFLRGAFPMQTIHMIVRDQVHFSVEPPRQKPKRMSLADVVIYPRNQNVFERDHSAFLLLIKLACGSQFSQWIPAIYRHD